MLLWSLAGCTQTSIEASTAYQAAMTVTTDEQQYRYHFLKNPLSTHIVPAEDQDCSESWRLIWGTDVLFALRCDFEGPMAAGMTTDLSIKIHGDVSPYWYKFHFYDDYTGTDYGLTAGILEVQEITPTSQLMIIDDPVVYPIDLLTNKPLSEDPEDIDEITLRVQSRTSEPLMFFEYDEWPCHSGMDGNYHPPWGDHGDDQPVPEGWCIDTDQSIECE